MMNTSISDRPQETWSRGDPQTSQLKSHFACTHNHCFSSKQGGRHEPSGAEMSIFLDLECVHLYEEFDDEFMMIVDFQSCRTRMHSLLWRFYDDFTMSGGQESFDGDQESFAV